MVQIPDNMRPAAELFAKYHFWLVALLVPLIVLPVLAAGNSGLLSNIAAKRSEIESKLSQVRRVSSLSPHPNEQWSETINTEKDRVREDMIGEWGRFWDSQKSIRVWPEELGNGFIRNVTSLRPGGELGRNDLMNYGRRVPRFVQALPARMGAEEMMGDVESARDGGGMPRLPAGGRGMAAGFGPGMPPGAGPRGPRPIITWNPADQQELFQSFVWDSPPSTIQVLMSQEELWVYGVLCDVLKRVNEGATGGHDSAVTYVEELAVGYRAAEDDPGGAGRLYVPPTATVAAADSGEMSGFGSGAGGFDMQGGPEGGRPPHPRFKGAGGSFGSDRSAMGSGGMADTRGAAAQTSSDGDFLNWAYVDFSGKPLLAEELTSTPGIAVTRLMPFRMVAVIDQRKLDSLLVTMATWPMPIEVRQVRINPGAANVGTGMDMGGGMGSGGGMARGRGGMAGGRLAGGRGGREAMGGGAEGGTGRPHDVTVEIVGTIALATPPGSKPPQAAGSGDDLGLRTGAGGFPLVVTSLHTAEGPIAAAWSLPAHGREADRGADSGGTS